MWDKKYNHPEQLSFHELIEFVRAEKSRYNIARVIGKIVPGFTTSDIEALYIKSQIKKYQQLKKSA